VHWFAVLDSVFSFAVLATVTGFAVLDRVQPFAGVTQRLLCRSPVQQELLKAGKHSDAALQVFFPRHALRRISGTICRVNTASCFAGVT